MLPVRKERNKKAKSMISHPLEKTVGWVARLCRSWLSLWKEARISQGRNANQTIQLSEKEV